MNNKILAVEDDPTQQFVLKVVLESYGLQADIVSTAEKALEHLDSEDNDYALILMDIRLPGMDGYDCSRLIRKKDCARISSIPILAVTAYAASEDRRQCLEAGMNDYISKPYQLDVFQRLINKYMQNGSDFERVRPLSFEEEREFDPLGLLQNKQMSDGGAFVPGV
ncbi:MAG TPA: response regulator [Drouetiella sp.]